MSTVVELCQGKCTALPI